MTSRNDAPALARTPAHRHSLSPRARGSVAALLLAGTLVVAACSGDDGGADAGTSGGSSGGASGGASGGSTGSGSSAATGSGTSGSESASGTTGAATEGETSGGASTSGGDPALEALCLEVEGSIAAGLAGDCECAVGAGEYPSVEACLTDKGIAPGFGACRCPIAAGEPAMAPYFECVKPVAADFAACIAGLGCADPDALDNCYFIFLDASECPPSVAAVDAEVEFVCRGAAPFMCTSGESIPDTWVCDLDENCSDGSDESRCPVFMCMSGEEIPLDWRCDGAPDCPDGDDEVDCP